MRKEYMHIARLFMLASSFVLLLTVVIPHHHHEDGMPCILLSDMGESHDTDEDHHYGCECAGHTLAFNPNVSQDHPEQDGATLHLMPLPSIAAYMYAGDILVSSPLFPPETPLYVESLHGTWTPVATGLRAPPVIG
ncbi:MAG: hypothetical protein LBQ78_02620 [Tannerellaceae bacterium]|jgi:hypothetical protein|nr:hypothetical protein [Tannerellaceae bacterium]